MMILIKRKVQRLVGVSAVLLYLTACSEQSTNLANDTQQHVQSNHQQQLFALKQVSLSASPFLHAQQTNVRYLQALHPDQLLAPYLREAGIEPKAASYDNWESSGLDGHIGGHYLSALSLAWAATGDEQLKQRLDYMLHELARAQQANGGYLGGIPEGQAMWQQIQQGEIKADLFSLNERWVPLYNIDKVFHGLRDAYLIAGSEQAKQMLFNLGEWFLNLTANLSDEQIQQMLYSEYGGLNEVFADMSNISGDKRYLVMARQFSQRSIIAPLLKDQDQLTGLHANTQIPKIIGMLKVADASDDEVWQQGADFFWQTVTKERSVAIGGNSVREHFHDKNDFTAMVEDVEGPETCNTYNMMKLSKLLFLKTGDTEYLDYYERATYNHILSSQHPEHGGLVYFTSMRPGHYRTYSSVQDSMWCCVGSGIENHSKYGELIYSHSDNNLWVNLFIPSTLNWHQQGLAVTQQSQFPDANEVSLTINRLADKPMGELQLHIRKPLWLQAELHFKLNGKAITATAKEGYYRIKHHWQDGDKLSFSLQPKLYTEQLPDGQNYYAVLYGPVVMATKVQAFANEQLDFVADNSRMGHIAAGPTCPPEALPIMLSEPAQFIAGLTRKPNSELAFYSDSNVAIAKQGIGHTQRTELIPFFRLHDSRYQVYWPQQSKAEFAQFMADAKATEQVTEQLRQLTVDHITPGEQQPEVEHDFKGEATRAGVNNGHHWRDATGWFEYQLSNPEGAANALRIRYFNGDVNRHFTITINGEKLASVNLTAADQHDEFYTIDYPLTEAMRNAKQLTLRFSAEQDSVAGGIYGIRLIKLQ
ncbi:beta-L-arabinofuranosidase domain-containing protein [Pseudoalteromonas mariniglutinosa]|uniref:beta-L-arabinofuranosidase domain-containing protein n=1 Tax=Pseudoalteromonas mariniglutinosa TaxID=206042 RepID=UPI00384F592A